MPDSPSHRMRMLEHLEKQAMPMKRWNQKGSKAAIVRMSELRAAKLSREKVDLMYRWAEVTGRSRERVAEWWTLAQADGLGSYSSDQVRIDWLKAAIAKARGVLHQNI